MAFKSYDIVADLRRRYPYKAFHNRRWVMQRLLRLKSAGNRSIKKPRSWWVNSEHRQHFGPKSRIADLFQRKDEVHLKLEAQRLQWYETPPRLHHDLLGAVANVGRLEERINYTFKNKMTCVEALKVTSSITPLFFKGMIHRVDRNNRLALLGDRVLRLALCEIWFPTGNSTSDYMKMHVEMESRASLAEKGRAIGLHKELLLPEGVEGPKNFQIAESFEAIIGAIYLDSGKSIEAVKKVINNIKLDDHEFLRPQHRSRSVQQKKELWYHHAEGVLLDENTEALERETLALQKDIQEVDASTKQVRDSFTIDSQMKVHVQRRIEYLRSLSPWKRKENASASSRNQQGDDTIADLQTQTDSKENVVDDSQPIKSLSSNNYTHNSATTIVAKQQDSQACTIDGQGSIEVAKELAIEIPQVSSTAEAHLGTAEPPECTNATIIDLMERMRALTKRKSITSSRRALRYWKKSRTALWKEAWGAANIRASSLQVQRLPADTGALFEEILQEKLEAALKKEQHKAVERHATWVREQILTSKGTQKTDILNGEENKASGSVQKKPSKLEKPKRRGAKAISVHDKLKNDGFDLPSPQKPVGEARTYVRTLAKSRKIVTRNVNMGPTLKRPLFRRVGVAGHRTGP